jgi:hypothetical protein
MRMRGSAIVLNGVLLNRIGAIRVFVGIYGLTRRCESA